MNVSRIGKTISTAPVTSADDAAVAAEGVGPDNLSKMDANTMHRLHLPYN